MGVDYYSCNHCGGTFSDAVHYVYCGEDCDNHWCSDKCANEDGYVDEHCTKYDVYGWEDLCDERKIRKCQFEHCEECPDYKPKSCKYCREEDYEDNVLLDKALDLLAMTREDLIGIIRKEKERQSNERNI